MRHFAMLDGLRGIAALVVVLYHLFEAVPILPQPPRAYLAVDFFFLLSGYVVGHAYDGKLRDGMTVARFAAIRLVRLYPLIVAGVLLGAAVWLVDAGRGYGPAQVIAATAAALVMLPVPRGNGGRAWPINSPLWSLAFELAGNLVYAIAAPRLATRTLALVVVGLLPALVAIGWANHGLMVGPLWRATLPLGLVRMAFPFALGLLLFRVVPIRPAIPCSGPLSALLLTALLCAPVRDGAIYDAAAVILAFPAVLLLALRAEPGTRAARRWRLAGALSYPVYTLHQPIVQAAGAIAAGAALDPAGRIALALATMALVLGLAWAALVAYDIPVRGWLSRRWLHRARPVTPRI